MAVLHTHRQLLLACPPPGPPAVAHTIGAGLCVQFVSVRVVSGRRKNCVAPPRRGGARGGGSAGELRRRLTRMRSERREADEGALQSNFT